MDKPTGPELVNAVQTRISSSFAETKPDWLKKFLIQ